MRNLTEVSLPKNTLRSLRTLIVTALCLVGFSGFSVPEDVSCQGTTLGGCSYRVEYNATVDTTLVTINCGDSSTDADSFFYSGNVTSSQCATLGALSQG